LAGQSGIRGRSPARHASPVARAAFGFRTPNAEQFVRNLPTERNRPATVINPINASETAAVYEHHGNAMKGTEMRDLLTAFAKDESGATAIEYGLIAAALGTGIIVAVNTLGSQLKATFSNLSSQLATAGK
jgi:pilus assembly protein Flp/PilA